MSENNGSEFAPATPMNSAPEEPQVKKSFCKFCGGELQLGAAFCPSCGKPQGNTPVQQGFQQVPQQAMYGQPAQPYGPVQQPAYMAGAYQQPQNTSPNASSPAQSMATSSAMSTNTSTTVVVNGGGSNGLGTAGFIFAILAFFVCWIPFVDFIVWFFGALFSFIGLFKKPRGLAIAGFILSFIGIIILVTFFGAIIGFANLSGR